MALKRTLLALGFLLTLSSYRCPAKESVKLASPNVEIVEENEVQEKVEYAPRAAKTSTRATPPSSTIKSLLFQKSLEGVITSSWKDYGTYLAHDFANVDCVEWKKYDEIADQISGIYRTKGLITAQEVYLSFIKELEKLNPTCFGENEGTFVELTKGLSSRDRWKIHREEVNVRFGGSLAEVPASFSEVYMGHLANLSEQERRESIRETCPNSEVASASPNKRYLCADAAKNYLEDFTDKRNLSLDDYLNITRTIFGERYDEIERKLGEFPGIIETQGGISEQLTAELVSWYRLKSQLIEDIESAYCYLSIRWGVSSSPSIYDVMGRQVKEEIVKEISDSACFFKEE